MGCLQSVSQCCHFSFKQINKFTPRPSLGGFLLKHALPYTRLNLSHTISQPSPNLKHKIPTHHNPSYPAPPTLTTSNSNHHTFHTDTLGQPPSHSAPNATSRHSRLISYSLLASSHDFATFLLQNHSFTPHLNNSFNSSHDSATFLLRNHSVTPYLNNPFKQILCVPQTTTSVISSLNNLLRHFFCSPQTTQTLASTIPLLSTATSFSQTPKTLPTVLKPHPPKQTLLRIAHHQTQTASHNLPHHLNIQSLAPSPRWTSVHTTLRGTCPRTHTLPTTPRPPSLCRQLAKSNHQHRCRTKQQRTR